jgi:hypothetical protein
MDDQLSDAANQCGTWLTLVPQSILQVYSKDWGSPDLEDVSLLDSSNHCSWHILNVVEFFETYSECQIILPDDIAYLNRPLL